MIHAICSVFSGFDVTSSEPEQYVLISQFGLVPRMLPNMV